ncbi:RNA-binding protein [Lactobacillus sp. PV034]|uniref:YlmH family RNA-binding protein n=1 Tax=Lactobacillus sp. PV034 TaxID=2594495 RepID=UPI00223F83FF|nr:YlmH/Sll1252 family protein [Lactobacillus sp. PV034]QNQ81516.1 RNA-binding protein [Lactobacillus sp. PV034]
MEKRQASSFYQHFDPEERPVVDFFTGLFNRFIFTSEPILTDFLNPRERYIFKKIVGNEAQIVEFGGYQNAEKRRIYLCEWEENISPEMFEIVPIQINYNQKWNELSHSQILGVLTHLGVELSTFGDIINNNKVWQFFVKAELANFFIENITRIGRSKVDLLPISKKEIVEVADDSVEATAVSVTLRLDAVVAAVTNLSRSQVKRQLLEKEIKLNWHETTESNIIVSEDDILSIRHFGRIKIIGVNTTKKGKYRLNIKLWQSKKR